MTYRVHTFVMHEGSPFSKALEHFLDQFAEEGLTFQQFKIGNYPGALAYAIADNLHDQLKYESIFGKDGVKTEDFNGRRFFVSQVIIEVELESDENIFGKGEGK